ncbi:glycoside hydrolase family 88/105 protein [Paenibacillus fonticola]|uniref:glycoside hydrolase family 88/105 protein n=1 Tax=Paenibacillus fonticola TaxID=379896 RepID=UPI00035F92A4|nr:glycoside hydrolase family 88 protein [Paenibacillus fonticola]
MSYFEPRESMRSAFGDDDHRILEVLAARYVGANSPVPFAIRPFSVNGIMQTGEGLYDMDMAVRLPQAKSGDYAYIFGKVWSDDEREIDVIVEPLGPVRVYVREELLYQSTAVDEMKPDARAVMPLCLHRGWNPLLIEARRTEAGFGCRFGAEEAKVRILQVQAPFTGREGHGGWAYAGPVQAPRFGGQHAFPDPLGGEEATGLTWLPRVEWTEEEKRLDNCERLFGMKAREARIGADAGARAEGSAGGSASAAASFGAAAGAGAIAGGGAGTNVGAGGSPEADAGAGNGGGTRVGSGTGSEGGIGALGWTRLDLPPASDHPLVLEGRAAGKSVVWLDGRVVAKLPAGGVFRVSVPRPPANPQLLVYSLISESESGDESEGESDGEGRGWGFELQAYSGTQPLKLLLPVPVQGCASPWLYAGPLSPGISIVPEIACRPSALFPCAGENEGGSAPAFTAWRPDLPDTYIRFFYENAMLSSKWTSGSATNFGRWDYPLGVTMYGLLRTSRELGRPDLLRYALEHIRSCTDLYEYALWDKERYGFPGVNHQLVLIRMLDNCGSFGSAMLEAARMTEEQGGGKQQFLRIADMIAEFMLQRLERRPDGAFFRECPGEYSADTMWADDLYMSVPFLIRYAEAAGKPEALDEAARQCLLFNSYLFMEQEGVMSHVFDFKYGKPTRVPWGRGNGWVLFTLSELLEKLPEGHADRGELVRMYRQLCKGITALQSASGLWHQVLNRPDAYEEASCTAMFVYALARGVRFGWIEPELRHSYAATAMKGWRGLTEQAMDRRGNVHGVCSGSRYSFIPDYYMYDLRTVVNDNHGIGIMMLAGVEICRLQEQVKREGEANGKDQVNGVIGAAEVSG